MPSLQQLRYLVRVADTLSFSRAAEMCHVSQPTLSMQIKELEAKLGVRLIERTRARVLMTQVGEDVAHRARTILAEIADLRDIAAGADPARPAGLMQLGVEQTVGAYVLSLAIPALRTAFGDLRLQVREDRPAGLRHALTEGAHDLVLLPSALDGKEVNGLRQMHLMREPLHVVVPVDHPLAGKPRISPTDLRGEVVLSMDNAEGTGRQSAMLCARVGAIHRVDYAGTSLDTLRQMVATGMGISLLPALYIRSEVAREQTVVARPLTEAAPWRDITLVWRDGAPRAAAYAQLGAMLVEILAPWAGAPEAQAGA